MVDKKLDKELTDAGFEWASAELAQRLIVSACGMEKEGKTHFGLTAPDPLAYFSIDMGDEGVVQKFITEGKRIIRKDMTVPKSQDMAEELWDGCVKGGSVTPAQYKKSFIGSYHTMLARKDICSIVFDTSSELWELIRMARFGTKPAMPFQYAPVNAEFRALIRAAYKSNKNLVMLHKMRKVYVNDKFNGEYERAGFGDTGYLAQVNCQMWREEAITDENGKILPGAFHLHVRDCRHNPLLAGEDMGEPMCTFPFLASMVIEGTSPADWGAE